MTSTQHGRLKKLDEHPYYFQDPVSERIYYIKKLDGRVVKISTGETKITKAKAEAERKLIRLLSDNPEREIREKKGIKNPRLSDLWTDVLGQRLQRSAATKKIYAISWKYGIEPFWGSLHISDVNQRTVARYETWYMKERGERFFLTPGRA